MIHTFFQIVLLLGITVDLPFSAGKIAIDLSDCNSFKILRPLLDKISLEGLES